MTYQVRVSAAAQADLERLFEFLAEHDYTAALRARIAIEKAYALLTDFPLSCRRVSDDNPSLREMLVSFGNTGYVLLFEVAPSVVTLLAMRHQREEDYH